MNRKTKTIVSLVALLTLVTGLVFAPLGKAEASSLTSSFLVLSDITADLATGVTLTLAINPSAGTTPTNVKIQFPDAEDAAWCTAAGALTVAGVTTAAANNGGGEDVTAALPGTLVATCAQGSGAGSYDTITITGVTAVSSGTVYGVQLSGNTGTIGTDAAGSHLVTVSINTGAVVDSLTYGISTVTDGTVVISATVAAAPTVTCSLSATTVDLGTLYQAGTYASGSHTISATTSAAAGGYWWAAYGTGDASTDAGLYKSSATTDLLPSTGSAQVDLRTADQGFGVTASAATGATVVADFVDTTAGLFGALDRAFAGAQLVTYQHSANTSADVSTITYGGRADGAAQVGSYQETVTWICGGYY